jgi:hypothetical protein
MYFLGGSKVLAVNPVFRTILNKDLDTRFSLLKHDREIRSRQILIWTRIKMHLNNFFVALLRQKMQWTLRLRIHLRGKKSCQCQCQDQGI